MKLLFCVQCFDVFKLDHVLRRCKCGEVAGLYIDGRHAEVNGKGVSLAINNYSLLVACRKLGVLAGDDGESGPPALESPVECWVRPHDGPTNPHTQTNAEIEERITRLASSLTGGLYRLN